MPDESVSGAMRPGALQKSDRFIERVNAFLGPHHCLAGKDENVAVKTCTQSLR